MKTFYSWIIGIVLIPAFYFSSLATETCGTDILRQRQLLQPDYVNQLTEFENRIASILQSNSTNGAQALTLDPNTTYTIPVVFHVIHTGGAVGTIYNPSDATIQAMMTYLNNCYSNSNGLGVNVNIQFALAQRTPNCTATNGIVRINGSVVPNYAARGLNLNNTTGADELLIKDLSRWDPANYLNIWVVSEIDNNDGTSGAFTAGYAYLPPASSDYDGIVMLATQVGNGFTTLPHEAGHYLGLYHTFQGDNNGASCPTDAVCGTSGDCCADTPPHLRSNGTCPGAATTCSGAASNNVVRNYMDYSSCQNRFTTNQRSRIRATLGTYRPGLVSSAARTAPPSTLTANACTPNLQNANNNLNMGPLLFSMSNVEMVSGSGGTDGALSDFTCNQFILVNPGQTYGITVNTATNPQRVRVYIDYNNNGTLNDAGETVFSSNLTGVPQSHTGNITIPASPAFLNTPLRLRVWADFTSSGLLGPCGNVQYGQAEDYTLYIQSSVPTISTSAISGSPYCPGENITVPFSITGTFNAGNIFTAQLSDASGSFASPTSIGTLSATAGGNITATIPVSAMAGTGYRIRVVSSSPVINGSNNGSNLEISGIPVASITGASSRSVCSGETIALTANTGTGLTYRWLFNNAILSGVTASSYSTGANGNYQVEVSNAAGCADTSAVVSVSVLNSPGATITPTGTINGCSGVPITLTANSGSGLSYRWQRNSANIGGATNLTYDATTSGNYRVIVSNSNNCEDTSSLTTLTFNTTPAITVSPAGPLSICQGTSTTLSSTTGSGYTFQWQRNGSDINGATATSLSVNSAGTYRAIATLGSCSDTSAEVVVSILARTNASLSPNGNIAACNGSTVTLNTTGGSGLTYRWQRNGSNIGGATTSTLDATTSGTYRAIVTNAALCSDTSADAVITFSPSPISTVSPAGPLTICQGSTASLTSTGGTGYQFQWQRNNTDLIGANSATYGAVQTGTYRAIVSVGNCRDTSNEVSLTVNTSPIATLTQSGTLNLCTGVTQILNTPVSSGVTYQWQRNGSNINGATDDSLTVNSNGTYAIILTNPFNCRDTSASVSVNYNPNPSAVISPAGNSSACQGDGFTYQANVVSGYGYQWQRNGSNIPSATADAFVPNSSGNYRVITQLGNCFDTSSVAVLQVNPTYQSTLQLTVCDNDSVLLPDGNYTSIPNQYVFNFQTVSGCDSIIQANVTSRPSPVVNINAGNQLTICPGDTIAVTAQGANSYEWNDGTIDSVFLVTAAGLVQVTGTSGGCQASDTLLVDMLPGVTLSAIQGEDTAQSNQVYAYTITVSGNPALQWTVSGGQIIGSPNQTSVQVRWQTPGTGSLRVSGTAGICSETRLLPVLVVLSSHNAEENPDQILIYPSPAGNFFKLTSNLKGTFHYRILSLLGEEMKSGTLQSDQVVNIQELAQGMYALELQYSGTTSVRPLLIIRE